MTSSTLELRSRETLRALTGAASADNALPPSTADAFAEQVIRTICEASVTPQAGRQAFERCMRALAFGGTSRAGFRHAGKAEAVDRIWHDRERLFAEFTAAANKRGYLASLPWIGEATQFRLARRLGLFGHDGRRAVA